MTLTAGAHAPVSSAFAPLRGWYPIEFLHFPIRSFEQCERKYSNMTAALGESRNAYYDQVRRAFSEGRFAQFYESLTIDDDALERGLSDGSLVVDTRLRDALGRVRDGGGFVLPSPEGRLSFPRPSVVDEAAYAVDVAALGEAEVVRVQRRLDTLETRLAAVEGRPSARLGRALQRAAHLLSGRDRTEAV